MTHLTAPAGTLPAARIGRGRGSGTVAHGALSVPASAEHDYETAVAYLRKDSVMASIIDRLEHGSTHVRLKINHDDDDSYDPGSHVLHWDPHSALAVDHGGTQSPALGLGHEMDHAVVDAATRERLQMLYDPMYDNAEERRVITGAEHHAALTLGESVRHDHAGNPYQVASPVAR